MASAVDAPVYVQFPSDLPQWEHITQLLTELKENLLANPSSSTLVKQLNVVHEIVHAPESPGTEKRNKRQKGFNAVTAGGVFKGLGIFLAKEISKEEAQQFFQATFPCIVHHACAVGDRKPHEGLKLLLRQEAATVQLPRSLVASIVACGFLCLFPGRKADRTSAFSPMNFDGFFCHLTQPPQCAKLHCLLNYFRRLASSTKGPKGHLTFTRKVLTDSGALSLEDIRASDRQLCPIQVSNTGFIEDSGHHFLHVDFANRKIGGGVLGTGRVQEEIRFCVSPELLSSMLLFEALDDNEAILIEGFETFSAYSGYARTLQYAGNMQDTTAKRDAHGNLDTSLSCIDALPRAKRRQYEPSLLVREINKAVIGFCPVRTKHLTTLAEHRPKPTPEMESFGDKLSSSIITKAVEEAAVLLSSRRSIQASGGGARQGGAVAAVRRLKRRGSCQVTAGGSLLQADRLSVGTHSEGESGHSDTSDMEESLTPEPDMFPPPDQPYPDRAWFLAQRRRSSNLSDLSRRSSDAISRRSSRSSSTRWSSDFSSDFEEFYESLQRPRHAAIEEEIGSASLQSLTGGFDLPQEYVQSLVADSVTEGSGSAAVSVAHMMPGLQHFEESVPSGVARPRARRPAPGDSSPSISPIHPDLDPANQTDDEKIQDNIVTFAGNLVGEMLQGSTPPREFSSSSSSGESVLNALGISAEDLLSVRRHARSRGAVSRDVLHGNHDDNLQSTSRRSSGSSSSRTGHHDEPPAVSNVVNRLVGGAISEALSVQNLRRHAAEQGLISPVALMHQGPSLTDDIKEALASSSARSYSAGSSPRGARASIPNTQFLHPRYSLTSTSLHYTPPTNSLQHHQHSPPTRPEIFLDLEEFAQNLARTIVSDAKRSAASQLTFRGARPKTHGSHFAKPHHHHHHHKVRADSFVPQRKPEMQVVAEQLVMSTVQGAVEEVYGYRHVRVPFSDTPIPQRQRSASATVIIRRKGSTEEDLTDFVEDLNQRCSFGNMRQSRRHTTTGFRDETLADFANELMTSNPNSPSFKMFEEEVNRTNMEVPKLFLGESAFGRRGSNSSRASSSDRSPRRGKQRRSSFDLLLESFTKFSASIEKYIKFDIEDTRSTHSGMIESDMKSSSREALFKFLARCRSKDALRKKRTSSISHLDWYVEDLVIDSFHDSFVYIFGDNYSEIIEKTDSKSTTSRAEQQKLLQVPKVRKQKQKRRCNLAVQRYVSNLVDVAFSEAFQCLRQGRSGTRKKRTFSYEDATDVPPSLGDYALSLADEILRQVISEVTTTAAKDENQQVLECKPVATGNWGCGAFGGDAQLKSLIQWAAASLCGAPRVNYYTFRDERMARFEEVSSVISREQWTVGRLMCKIVEYCERRVAAQHPEDYPTLFDSLLRE